MEGQIDCGMEGMMVSQSRGGCSDSAQKMPSTEGALRAPSRALVIEEKKNWKNVIEGSQE